LQLHLFAEQLCGNPHASCCGSVIYLWMHVHNNTEEAASACLAYSLATSVLYDMEFTSTTLTVFRTYSCFQGFNMSGKGTAHSDEETKNGK
jgi:hypothetical protein